jgi:23S rRNA (uracil1939-C5)-methyltransferase
MVTVVVTSDCSRPLKSMLTELKGMGHHIASGYMNINDGEGNNIFGEDSRRLIGADRIRENLCELQFEIGPTSFFQVNPWQAENIYRRVEQLAGSMPRGATAWDLYCGTGTLSMVLARNGYRILGIEENPQATRDAEANVRRNELSTSPHFMAGRVEDLVEHLPTWTREPSLIVTNPSRRGMADEALRTVGLTLAQKENSMLLYVSCEAETLIRDIKKLETYGLYLRQLEAFDMFPFTEKLEWLAVLVRK